MSLLPPLELDSARDLAGLQRGLARVGRLLELPEPVLRAKHPEISGWSLSEQAFHIVLAGDLSLRNARSLARGKGMLVREPEVRSAETLAILTRGLQPRGVAEAPRFVRPPAVVDLPLCAQLLGEVRDEATALGSELEALGAEQRCVPHQILGDLTGPEWLRFARAHSVHHLLIVRDLLVAAAV